MARVTRPDGVVAACVWDHAGERSPLAVFWRAANELSSVSGRVRMSGVREGHLVELFVAAGLRRRGLVVVSRVEYSSFDEWWEPYTFGIGPAGAFVAALDPEQTERVRTRCRELLPAAPFELVSYAWAARGVV
jgi:hypothetical protein